MAEGNSSEKLRNGDAKKDLSVLSVGTSGCPLRFVNGLEGKREKQNKENERERERELDVN